MKGGSSSGSTRAPARAVTALSPRDDVFRQQMVVVGSVVTVLVLVFALSRPQDRLATTYLSWGLVLLLSVTAAASVVPWDRHDRAWRLAVPAADVLAIMLFRMGQPDAGFGVILTVPVIWMASARGRLGPALGASVPALCLAVQVVLEQTGAVPLVRPASLPATGSIALTLAFVAFVTAASNHRLRSQRALLRHQSEELEQALEATTMQEQALRSIMNSVRFGLLTLDAEGRVMTSNPAVRELVGRWGIDRTTPVEQMPLYAADGSTRLRPEDLPLMRALRGEEVASQVIWIGHRDGPRAAVEVGAHVLLKPDGRVDRVVLVLRDLTEDLAAERRRDDLVTAVSHEFRTPLTSVLGYLDLALDDDDLPAAVREQLDIARRNTVRVQSLVGDLLVTRSRDAASTELTLEDVDLTALAAEAVRSLEPVAADRSVTLRLDAPAEAWVRGDAFRLRQVLDNVLSNAIKYNVPHGEVVVTVPPTTEEGQRLVSIRDTGEGLDPQDAARLFEPFFRSEDARTSGTVGTGLGLTICREIVEQHGGTIEVDSERGHGTEVVVRLMTSQEAAHGS